MFLLLRVQGLNGMNERRREQRQGGWIRRNNQRRLAGGALLLKRFQAKITNIERQQRQLAKLLLN